MPGKGDVFSELRVYCCSVVLHMIVIGQRGERPRCQIVPAPLFDDVQRINPGLGSFQRRGVNVGRVDGSAVEDSFLEEHYGDRIQLFSGGTTRVPYFCVRPGAEHRHNMVSQRRIDERIAEKSCDVDREIGDEVEKKYRFTQYPADYLRYAGYAVVGLEMGDTPVQGLPCILPEVIAITQEDGLKQQIDFHVDDLRCGPGEICRHSWDHRQSSTRMREVSRSGSTGLER